MIHYNECWFIKEKDGWLYQPWWKHYPSWNTFCKMSPDKKKRRGKSKDNVGNVENNVRTEIEDDPIAWRHIIFWQFLGVCLPTFDVYSDLVFMIVNLLQFYPVQNDYEVSLHGMCHEGTYANVAYCKLSYSEQCKYYCICRH